VVGQENLKTQRTPRTAAEGSEKNI
jgi:hypothetical protein